MRNNAYDFRKLALEFNNGLGGLRQAVMDASEAGKAYASLAENLTQQLQAAEAVLQNLNSIAAAWEAAIGQAAEDQKTHAFVRETMQERAAPYFGPPNLVLPYEAYPFERRD